MGYFWTGVPQYDMACLLDVCNIQRTPGIAYWKAQSLDSFCQCNAAASTYCASAQPYLFFGIGFMEMAGILKAELFTR